MRFANPMRCGVAAAILMAMALTAQAATPITWNESLTGAFQTAVDKKLPLVVYFYKAGCEECQKLQDGPLAGAELAAYGERAVFARIDEGKDDAQKNVGNMLKQLNVTKFPYVTVLDCSPSQITERGGISGLYDTAEFVRRFETAFGATPAAPAPAAPAAIPAPPAAPVTEATISGGIVLTKENLGTVLKDAGYIARLDDEATGAHVIDVERDGWKFYIRASLANDGSMFWLHQKLGEINLEHPAAAAKLLEMLKETRDRRPAMFGYDAESKMMYFSSPIANQGITPAKLQENVNYVINSVIGTRPMWDVNQWTTAPAAPTAPITDPASHLRPSPFALPVPIPGLEPATVATRLGPAEYRDRVVQLANQSSKSAMSAGELVAVFLDKGEIDLETYRKLVEEVKRQSEAAAKEIQTVSPPESAAGAKLHEAIVTYMAWDREMTIKLMGEVLQILDQPEIKDGKYLAILKAQGKLRTMLTEAAEEVATHKAPLDEALQMFEEFHELK